MGYHFSRAHKEPKTRKEKLEAAKQYFIVASIGTAVTFASIGWVYWQQNTQAELSKAQAERSKINDELFRDLARTQASNSKASNSQTSNSQQQPSSTSYVSSEGLLPILLPSLFAAVSLLMFYMAISHTIEARRMIEPPEK